MTELGLERAHSHTELEVERSHSHELRHHLIGDQRTTALVLHHHRLRGPRHAPHTHTHTHTHTTRVAARELSYDAITGAGTRWHETPHVTEHASHQPSRKHAP